MSKLIMWNLMSLDGFFEGETSWALDWFQPALDDNFFSFVLEQLRTAEALVFGRVTYDGMARHWPTATGDTAEQMNALPKIVFSRTLQSADWNNTKLVKDDPVAFVADLKRGATKNILVFGSADLSKTLMNAGLFDEIRIGLTSIVVGKGRPLFGEGVERQNLNLLEAKPLSAGCVVLRYAPAAKA